MTGDREYHVTVRVPAAAMPLLGIPRGQTTFGGFEVLWVHEIVPSGRPSRLPEAGRIADDLRGGS